MRTYCKEAPEGRLPPAGCETMNSIVDRRKLTDRRISDQPVSTELRLSPDRRLDNILVEWLPGDAVTLHPSLNKARGSRLPGK